MKILLSLIAFFVAFQPLAAQNLKPQILQPDPALNRKSKVLAGFAYVMFKSDAHINAANFIDKLKSPDNSIQSAAEMKILRPLLNPQKSLTYNEKLKINAMQSSIAVNKIVNAEEPLLRTFLVQFDASISPEEFCHSLLSRNKNIEYAEPLRINKIQSVPNDPMISKQDMLKQIKAIDAWENLKNSSGDTSVTIGISDVGVNQEHEDIAPNLAHNWNEIPRNGVDDDNNGYVDDFDGYNFSYIVDKGNPWDTWHWDDHGSEVAGIACAKANNGIGITGTGYNCRIFPLRCALDEDGNVTFAYESIVYAGVNKLQVLNCSWGNDEQDYSPIEQDVINFAVANDVAIVVAGGNITGGRKFGMFYPANYFGVLGVGEVDYTDRLTTTTVLGAGLDIMAPGRGNLSIGNGTKDYQEVGNGTSFAAPVEAGVVGLVRSKYPQLNALQALEHVRLSVDSITNVEGNAYTDYLPGRINVYEALSTEPFSRPAIRPIKMITQNTSGLRTNRFFEGDTVLMNVDSYNYLGAADKLTFVMRPVSDDAQYIKMFDSVITVNQIKSNAALQLGQFAFSIAKDYRSIIFLRVDIYGAENYHDFFLLPFVPTNNVTTYENPDIKFSLSDEGNVGYNDDDVGRRLGVGFIFNPHGNQLFKGGLLASIGNSTLVSSVSPGYGSEFSVLKPFAPPDQKTGIVKALKNMDIDITQNVYIPSYAAPYARINITAENKGDTVNDFALGYIFDWDINGAYDSNRIWYISEGLPDGYDKNNSAAVLIRHVDGSVQIGVSVLSDENNVEPQAAEFSKFPDITDQLNGINSGRSIVVPGDLVTDVSHIIGMKFPGPFNTGEKRTFSLMISCAENEADLINIMKYKATGVNSGNPSKYGSIAGTLFVSPQPANDIVRVELPENAIPDGDLNLYDLYGNRLVIPVTQENGAEYQLSASALAPGVYFLRYTAGGSTYVKNIVISR